MQGCLGHLGAPVESLTRLRDLLEPQKKRLQSLNKKTTNTKVGVQTRKTKGLGRGDKDMCGTGGLVGIGATSDI